MNFVFRIDDVGWTATETEPAPMKAPDVGLALMQRFHAAMQGLPYLAAIIPACVDADGLAWLRSKPPGLTPALHGWDHFAPGGVRSEFHNLNMDGMRALLDRGRRHLGMTVEHLVPPFNAIETGLPEACAREGIDHVWGEPSRWPTPPPPYPMGEVTFVPSWLPLYGATRWRMSETGRPLLELVPELVGLPGAAVITLHIPWQAAKEPHFESVTCLVKMIADRILTPSEFLEVPR